MNDTYRKVGIGMIVLWLALVALFVSLALGLHDWRIAAVGLPASVGVLISGLVVYRRSLPSRAGGAPPLR